MKTYNQLLVQTRKLMFKCTVKYSVMLQFKIKLRAHEIHGMRLDSRQMHN